MNDMEHVIIQIKILQQSIENINKTLDIIGTSTDKYWLGQSKQMLNNLKYEENKLQQYKIKYPEIFV
jgi:prefoldin subunit 5